MTTVPPAALPHDTSRAEPQFPDTFQLTAWADPVVDDIGFPPHHAYVELLWLPVIGPSSTWIYRRLAELAVRRPDHAVVVADLARCVGVGSGTGPTSPVQRSLRRIIRFGLAAWISWHGPLAVRTTAPPVSRRELDRLPADLQAVHRTLVAGRANRPRTDSRRS